MQGYIPISGHCRRFRRLGLYREALESIRQVAIRNVEGRKRLGKRVSESLRKIVTAEEWQPSVHAEIYEYLLALDLRTRQASVLLVLATEIAGLQKIPSQSAIKPMLQCMEHRRKCLHTGKTFSVERADLCK